MAVKRFGVSLEEEIMEMLDSYVESNQYPNRSQAIRHLIEEHTVEKKWQCNNEVAGAIVLVYDHHKNDITRNANEIQHNYHQLILFGNHSGQRQGERTYSSGRYADSPEGSKTRQACDEPDLSFSLTGQ
jgi:metal-responsive CopG/Arc/MetJ family transcriptional regulator